MEYKGMMIEEFMGLITVQYCGDEVVFGSIEEAKRFIEEVAE